MICPKCREDKAHRSHRNTWQDRLYSLFARTPYRCHNCKTRFYVFLQGEKSSRLRTPEERKILELRRRLKWKRTRRYLIAFALATAALFFVLYEMMQQSIHTE